VSAGTPKGFAAAPAEGAGFPNGLTDAVGCALSLRTAGANGLAAGAGAAAAGTGAADAGAASAGAATAGAGGAKGENGFSAEGPGEGPNGFVAPPVATGPLAANGFAGAMGTVVSGGATPNGFGAEAAAAAICAEMANGFDPCGRNGLFSLAAANGLLIPFSVADCLSSRLKTQMERANRASHG
jgi:hypothetical protein